MAEKPGPVARLDHQFASVMIAHEVIADLHDQLALHSASDDASRRLFRDAGQIAAIALPAAFAEAVRIKDLWAEQDLLDPDAATSTLELLAAELDRAEPGFREMRARQDEIAQELRRRVDDARGESAPA